MSTGGIGPGGHRMTGFRLQEKARPFVLEDPERRINEIAVIHTEPRVVVMVFSFSNPQARIMADGYRFIWFEGELMKQDDPAKLTRPILNPARKLNAFVVLTDADSVIDEIVLVKGADLQIANFGFSSRYIALHRPDFHLEWTAGVSIAEVTGDRRLILPPGALG